MTTPHTDVGTAPPSLATPALRFAVAGVAASLFLYLLFYRPTAAFDYNFGFGYGRDFINFWAAGRLASAGNAGLLADFAAYNAWLSAQFAGDIGPFHFYSYFPTMTALLIPFGWPSYGVALALWTAANLAAFAWAASLAPVNRGRAVLLAVLSPAAAACAFQGQMSAIFGALFFGALMLVDRRPVVSGILLGLLTLKPQLGLVAGLIVLLDRRITVALSAAATAAALIALSLAVFGPDAWIGYRDATAGKMGAFLGDMSAGFRYFLVTPFALLSALGLSSQAAMVLHALAAVPLAVAAIWVWRMSADRILAILVAALVSILATPYANAYDLTLTALPIAAMAASSSMPDGRPGAALWLVWLVPVLTIPVAIVSLAAAPLVLLAATALVLAAALGHRGVNAGLPGHAQPDRPRPVF